MRGTRFGLVRRPARHRRGGARTERRRGRAQAPTQPRLGARGRLRLGGRPRHRHRAPPRRCDLAVAGDALYLHRAHHTPTCPTASSACPASTSPLARSSGHARSARPLRSRPSTTSSWSATSRTSRSTTRRPASCGSNVTDRLPRSTATARCCSADGVGRHRPRPDDRRRVVGSRRGARRLLPRHRDRRRRRSATTPGRSRSSCSITAPATSAGQVPSRSTRASDEITCGYGPFVYTTDGDALHEWDALSGWLNWSVPIAEPGDIEVYREVALVRSGADAETIVAVERETGEVLLGASGRRGRHERCRSSAASARTPAASSPCTR